MIKIKCFFFIFLFLFFGCKFEVWRKKTHLILFQVGFFFNIYKFYFFLFFTLYLVSSSFKIISLYFPFLVSFVSIPFL
jgi:hypothetical protein